MLGSGAHGWVFMPAASPHMLLPHTPGGSPCRLLPALVCLQGMRRTSLTATTTCRAGSGCPARSNERRRPPSSAATAGWPGAPTQHVKKTRRTAGAPGGCSGAAMARPNPF